MEVEIEFRFVVDKEKGLFVLQYRFESVFGGFGEWKTVPVVSTDALEGESVEGLR